MAQAKVDFLINTKINKAGFDSLKQELQSIQRLSGQDLINFGSAKDLKEAQMKLESIKNSAVQVETAFNKAFSVKLGTVNLSKFNEELNKLDLKTISKDFKDAGVAGQVAFRDMTTHVLTTKTQIQESNKALNEMLKTFKNTIKWGISSSVWNSMVGSFERAYSYTKNLDKSLNSIRIVSGKSADEMERFAVQANRAARDLGKTTLDYTNAALIYEQQGLPTKDVAERAAITLKMASVTGESAEKVSDYMTAVWNNFYDGSKSLEYYADVMTSLGAATASSTDEISTGLEKFAGVANTIGLSYEYATSALTTITAETRQSAEVVGTALRTLFARIQGLTLGETLDDGTTLNKYSEALNKVGISIKDQNGELKEMDDILDDMGSKWNTLNKDQQVALAQTVAGTRQYNQIVTLMDNWDTMQANLGIAATATGELTKQNEIYMESTEAHLNKLSASTERLYKNLIDSDGLNSLVDMLSTLVNGAAEYTEAIGGSKSLLSQLGAIGLKVFGKDLSRGMTMAISNLRKIGDNAEQTRQKLETIKILDKIGANINDADYDKVVRMAEQVAFYSDSLTQEQIDAANASIQRRNALANEASQYAEARKMAEEYFSTLTNIELDYLEDTPGTKDELMKMEIDEYKETSKILQNIQKLKYVGPTEKGDLSDLDIHLNKLKSLQKELIRDEKLYDNLQTAIKNFYEIKNDEGSYAKGEMELNSEQEEALQKIVENSKKVNNKLVSNAKETMETINRVYTGEDSYNKVAEIDKDFKNNFLNDAEIQRKINGLTNITSSLMGISSAISGIKNLPNIWGDENLSGGEKILQTLIVIGNTAQGIASTFNVVHAAADLLSVGYIAQAGSLENLSKKQEKQNEKAKEHKKIQEEVAQVLKETAKSSQDLYQHENEQSSNSLTKLNSLIEANVIAINAQTKAIEAQQGARKRSLALQQKEIEEYKQTIGSLSEEALNKADTLIFDNKFTKIGDKYNNFYREILSTEQYSALTQDRSLQETFYRKSAEKFEKNEKRWNKEGVSEQEQLRRATKLAIKDTLPPSEKKSKKINKKTGDPTKNSVGDIKDNIGEATGALDTLKTKSKNVWQSFKTDLNAILTFLGKIPPQAYVAAAAFTTIGISIWAIAEAIETEKEKEERLQKEIDETAEAYKNASAAANELNSTVSNYNQAINGLEGLTKGTVEYYDAVLKANEAAQELIDKLNLIIGTDYTLSPDGLIQINEDVLDERTKKVQQESFRAQAANFSVRADYAELKASQAKDRLKHDINQNLVDSNVNYRVTDKVIESIINGRPEDVKPEDFTYYSNNDKYDYQEALEATTRQGFEYVKQNQERQLNSEENFSTKIFKEAINIDNALAKNLAEIRSNEAQEKQYRLAAAEATIRGYGSASQVEAYNNATVAEQELVKEYVARAKDKNEQESPDGMLNASLTGMAGGFTSGAATAAAVGALIGLVGGPIGSGIGTLIGSVIGGIGGAIEGAIKGRERQEKQNGEYLKEQYAKTALGYTKQDGKWIDSYGQEISKEDLYGSIDLSTAREAYENGDYAGKLALNQIYGDKQSFREYYIKQGVTDENSLAYMTEASMAAKNGLDYEYENLAAEELEMVQERFKTMSSNGGDEYKELLEAIADPTARLAQDLENYNTQLEREAEALGTTSKALKIYGDTSLAAAKGTKEKNKQTAEEIAKEFEFNKTYNKGIKTFKDSQSAYENWIKARKDGKKISAEEAEGVAEIYQSLEDLLGLEVSTDFFANNQENITKLFTGTEEEAEKAFEALQSAALQDVFKTLGNEIGLTEDELKNFTDIIQNLGNKDFTPKMDNTQFLGALNSMMGQTITSIEGMQEWLNSHGLKIKQGVETSAYIKEVTIPGTMETTKHIIGGDNPYTGKEMSRPIQYTETIVRDPQTHYMLDDSKNPNDFLEGGATNFTNFAPAPSNTDTGSGSSSKPKQEDRLEDTPDRYHDVNIELKEIANQLEDVQSETDQLVGQNRIDNLTKQFRLLNKEIATTDEKMKIANGEMQELQQKLANKGVQFSEDGSISNYTSSFTAQLDAVNRVIDHYNSLSADGQESYQDALDKAKEDFDEFKENIDRYDEVITDLIPGLQKDIQNAINEQIELELEAFNYEIELRINMHDATLEWNEFRTNILKDIEEDDILGQATKKLEDVLTFFENGSTGLLQAGTKHIEDILAELKQMDEENSANAYGERDTVYRAQALEDLKEYYSQIMESLTEIHDLSDEIHESYLDMMDEAQEKFDEQISGYETINNLIEHDKNLISMIYGEDSYSALSQFYDRQEENNNKQLDFQKQQVEFWKQQMDIAEAGSDAWEAAKEKWLSAVDQWNAAIENAIQNLKDKYLNAINEIFQNLNNQVTGGMGLDYVSTEWDLINKNADQYLDTVNSIYEVQKLQNKYLDAIEKTDSPTQQKKLNDLMQQETDYLREQDKLSKYDLDRANLKYEIALKQIALEEAQQNKNQLRLRRDSQGNYTYQYTADEDKVASVQQEISDLYNQLYNLDAEQYRGNLNELYDVWVEFQEKMAEAAQINDPEQRAAKELLIKEQYSELVNGLVEKNELLQSNLYQSTMSHLFDLYDQNTINYEEMSSEQREILDQFINAETDLSTAAFDNLFNLYNVNIESFKSMTETQKDILMGEIVPQWDTGVQAMIDKIAAEGGFLPTCQTAFTQLKDATAEYMTGLEELQKYADVNFEEVKNGIDEVITSTEGLLENNNELIDSYNKELEAIQSVIDQLDALVKKYEDAEIAAKKATEEAYKYWLQENNKNADVDSDIDKEDPNESKPTNTTPNAVKPATPSTTQSSKPSLNYGSYIQVKPGTMWYEDSWGGGASGYARAGSIRYINTNGPYAYNIDGLGWIRKTDIVGYASGGYTGDWPGNEGHLAMLHKKELVLNAKDTDNMLDAISIVRNIASNLGSSMMSKMASLSSANAEILRNGSNSNEVQQNVNIHAEFPNVTNSREVEDALNNLVNKAFQHVQK